MPAVLRRNTRQDAVIGRLGGDELAVLLPGCSERVGRERAEQLVKAIREDPLYAAGGEALHNAIRL